MVNFGFTQRNKDSQRRKDKLVDSRLFASFELIFASLREKERQS
jgi:hypothetical protein